MDCAVTMVVALSHRRKLPQGLQLSPCVTTGTVEMEVVVRWCGDEEGEETCVWLFDFGSVMVGFCFSYIDFCFETIYVMLSFDFLMMYFWFLRTQTKLWKSPRSSDTSKRENLCIIVWFLFIDHWIWIEALMYVILIWFFLMTFTSPHTKNPPGKRDLQIS